MYIPVVNPTTAVGVSDKFISNPLSGCCPQEVPSFFNTMYLSFLWVNAYNSSRNKGHFEDRQYIFLCTKVPEVSKKVLMSCSSM